MRGVSALRGSTFPFSGRWATTLQSKAMVAPHRIETGMRWRWSAVRKVRRAACGTARPMNEMGPQKAVTMAVSRPVSRSAHADAEIGGIVSAQLQNVERLCHQPGAEQAEAEDAYVGRQLLRAYSAEVAQSPYHKGAHTLCRCIKVEDGYGRRGQKANHHTGNEQGKTTAQKGGAEKQ